MYGKIFDSMYEGTLYGHWEAIVTLQQMLVLCDSAGNIDMTPQAIAARTSIPLDIISKGLAILAEPDQYSRTPGEEGRRIVLLDDHRPWGWRIVNHAKYQKLKSRAEKMEADRARIAEKRNTNKNKVVADSRTESHVVADVAHAATDAATNKKAERSPSGSRLTLTDCPQDWKDFCQAERSDLDPEQTFQRFRDFWIAKPGKDGRKLDWLATWRNWVRNEKAGRANSSGPPWWASNEGIDAKARELGIVAPKGASYADLKQLISARIGN